MYLSVIIPAYNEEKRLPKTLGEIDKYLRTKDYDYEILVVNDGSRDGTVKVAENLTSQINPSTGLRVNAEQSRSIKNLKVVGYEKNQGKGFAVRFGMLEAKGDYRLFSDADNSTSIDQIEKIWPELRKGFNIVIGSRDVEGAVLDPPQLWLRQVFLGEGFKLFRKIVLNLWEVEDTQCGFKCFSKKAAEDIFPKAKISRFAFDPEILIIGKKLGYKIKEIPVYWKNDLESRVKFTSIFKMALDMFKIRLNLILKRYDSP